jgi:redox-sensitive bicupin YhaK (pirin superfamily)
MMHRDSAGSVQRILPGDVNWMTAGRGIVHSERSTPEDRARGHRLHGLQTWVALPKAHEQAAPSFSHHPRASLPEIERPGVRMRVIAGTAFGQRAPAQTFSPTLTSRSRWTRCRARRPPSTSSARSTRWTALSVDGAALPSGTMAVLEPDRWSASKR